MTSEPILQLSGVVKSYGAVTALDGVDLRIDQGRYVGLLGPNGAGKSTLFQIVAGLFSQDDGEVRLFGVTHAREGAAIRRRADPQLPVVAAPCQSPRADDNASGASKMRHQTALRGGLS